MFALAKFNEARGRDESFKRFVDARDLPPDLQRETLEDLFRSAGGELRQRALRAGASLFSDEVLVGYLRNEDDDVLRNAGLEMLKLRGHRAFATAVGLLGDADSDVVLQAVLVLDAIRDPRARSPLRPLLQHKDPNVVQAAIMAAGHLGGANAARDIVPFLSADPWLQVAATQALGDLRSKPAVRHLRSLLSHPFLQQFAAEALARIGDVTAFRSLTDHWLSVEQEVEPQFYLELISEMLAQFERPPQDEKLQQAAERYLSSTDRATAAAAAWCVLALGRSKADTVALDLIAATNQDLDCPASLGCRSDLVTDLLRRDPPLRDWGYEILRRYPTSLPAHAVAQAIMEYPPSRVDAIGACLARLGDAALAPPLLRLWIERREERDRLTAAVRRHERALMELVASSNVTACDRLSLLEAMGAAPALVAAEISRLGEPERWEAVNEIRTRTVVKRLPWAAWIRGADREAAVQGLADAVCRTLCRELLPVVRTELAARPQRELVQVAGVLRDTESVPILAALLQCSTPLLRAAIFDSLGRIGGANARAVLRSYCGTDSEDVAQACRALTMCATEADCALLRAAADSPDLSVRLAIIAPLVSFPDEKNRYVLRRLLFDPSPAVSQKAHSVLDLAWSAA